MSHSETLDWQTSYQSVSCSCVKQLPLFLKKSYVKLIAPFLLSVSDFNESGMWRISKTAFCLFIVEDREVWTL